MTELPELRMLRQLKLEEEARGLGVKRYCENIDKRPTADSVPANRFMSEFLPLLSTAIQQFAEGASLRRNTAVDQLRFMKEFEGRYDQLSLMTLRACLTNLRDPKSLTSVAISLGSRLQDEIDYKIFEESEPKLYHWMRKDASKLTSDRVARGRFRRTIDKFGKMGERGEFEDKVKAALGAKLIDLAIKVTGSFVITKVEKKGRSINYLMGTEGIQQWIMEAHNRCEALSPLFLPMIVEPKDWTGPIGGGYWGPLQHSVRFVKTRDKDLLEELKNTDMPKVYASINALQKTPWRVNKGILATLKEVWDNQLTLGDLPSLHDLPLPARPANIDTDDEALRLWKYEAVKVYTGNGKLQSVRAQVVSRIWAAEKFRDEEEFYLPWSVDWRGRAYPVSTVLNPQGDDVCKSLIQFANGKPLGPSGGYWLAVHLAGLFGVDKVSFDERVEWVQENQDAIMDSALNPIEGERFWETADKPWTALAACFEWAGFTMEGEDYVSHMPIAMDGSCNGLQHFSAMLLDEVGGAAVNLIPQEQPADVYTEVLSVVERKVIIEADKGDPVAIAWLGNMSRKIVKRPVMTLPYGAGKYGMRDQVDEEVAKLLKKDPTCFGEVESFEASRYLASIIYDSIGEVVIAARSAMGWLQEVARLVAKEGLPIHWTTPVGFPVIQAYAERESTKIDVMLGRQRLRISLQRDTDKLNKKRQAQGISPNFVHSTDAAHMMSTVLLCLDNGVEDFAMIHDSYGCHAADSEIMFQAIRQAFVDQYSQPILENFRDEILQQIPEELRDTLPELPAYGNLDLAGITHSQYFFA